MLHSQSHTNTTDRHYKQKSIHVFYSDTLRIVQMQKLSGSFEIRFDYKNTLTDFFVIIISSGSFGSFLLFRNFVIVQFLNDEL